MSPQNHHQVVDKYIDFGIIYKEIVKYWYLFAIFLFLGLSAAFLFNKLATPSYKITASVLIKDSENNRRDLTEFLEGFELLSASESFENEILILNSPQLIERTLKSMDIEVSYFQEENILIKTELYKSTPFNVVFDRSHLQPVGALFQIVFTSPTVFKVTALAENAEIYSFSENKIYNVLPVFKMNKVANVGTNIVGENFSFKIIPNANANLKAFVGKPLFFRFNNQNNNIYSNQAKIKVSPHSPKSTVAIIDYNTTNIQKGLDFVNFLITNYIQKNVDRKNFFAERTVEYIDQQLSEITDSLNITEKLLQDFRVSNQVMNINEKSDRVGEQIQILDNSRYQLQVKENYYKFILDYFEKSKELSDIPIPSSMGVDDQVLTQLIQQLTAMDGERNAMEKNSQQKNPYYAPLVNRIENVKQTIHENLKYALNSIQLNMDDINQRMKKFQAEMNKLPRTERELFGIERKYKVTDAIYTFLLEKRAEAQITRASNLPDIEVVESAKFVGKSFPNSKINFILGVFAGLFIPGLFVFLKNVLNDKVTENVPIGKITSIPILGQIMHNHHNDELVFINRPKSAISESFRAIRTNLDYFAQGSEKRAIMLTSSVGQEGKSFTSLNLALCYSIYDRKTILLEFDLRKPTLYQKLGSENLIGLSSYLINKANIEDIIIHTKFKNLDFISCGPIPPNPTELIATDKAAKLIGKLKEIYDIIIIDSPPIGLVTDAYLLMKHADVKIYIVRQNVAPLGEFVENINEIEGKKIEGMSILLNDIKYRAGGGKYGYGYYEEPSTWKKIFRKKKKKS